MTLVLTQLQRGLPAVAPMHADSSSEVEDFSSLTSNDESNGEEVGGAEDAEDEMEVIDEGAA